MSSRTGIVPKRTGPYSRVDCTDAEYQRAVSRFLSVKDQSFAVSGSIPMPDGDPTTLFFRTSTGLSHYLPFPLKPDALHQLPALNVLLAACLPNIDDEDLDAEEGSGKHDPPLVFPSSLPFSTTFDLANHPVLDTVRSVLFPNAYPGTYLYAVRDKFEVFLAGASASSRQCIPMLSRVDDSANLVANVVLTLPVPHHGGSLVVRNPEGDELRFYPTNQTAPGITTLHWTAFRSDCDLEIEYIEQGCRMAITYGVYMKSFGPAGREPDPLLDPNEQLLGALALLLRLSSGRTLGVYMKGCYDCLPSEMLADSLVPHLKGGDSILYHALKAYKIFLELRWVAAGNVWPVDKTVMLKTLAEHESVPTAARQSLKYAHGASSRPTTFKVMRYRRRSKSKRASSPGYDNGPLANALGMIGVGTYKRSISRTGSNAVGYDDEDDEDEYLEDIVAAGGAVPLQETEIIILTARDRNVFRGTVPIVSRGELEQVEVNLLLVFYAE